MTEIAEARKEIQRANSQEKNIRKTHPKKSWKNAGLNYKIEAL
jgi:hypothetical protein